MRKKRLAASVLALSLCFSLAACSGGSSATPAPASDAPETTAPAETGAESDLAYVQDKGTLVIGSLSQLSDIRLLRSDGREERLVGEADKAALMGNEARDFRRYAADYDGCQEERRYAEELSAAVSEVMEEMRRQAGIRFGGEEMDV